MVAQRPQIANGLHWLRAEIDASLARARTALEQYIEAPEDPAALAAAADELRLVRGTVGMIECFGAATLAEEMLQMVGDLGAARVGPTPEALAALSGAILQLSDYVDLLTHGEADRALILQPLINELRLARGKPVVTEAELFAAQLRAHAPAAAAPPALRSEAAQSLARRELQAFQASFLYWFRGQAADTAMARIGKIADDLAVNAEAPRVRELWSATAALAECLRGEVQQDSLELKRLFGRAGSQIKRLAEDGEAAAEAQVADVPEQMLYYLSQLARQTERSRALVTAHGLAELLTSGEQLQELRRRLRGPNTSILARVYAEIRRDFAQVKDGIDLAVRTGGGGAVDLKAARERLLRLSSTCSALGLAGPQQALRNQAAALESAPPGTAGWMDIATAILRVEHSLEETLFRTLGRHGEEPPRSYAQIEADLPHAQDLRESVKALLREALIDLARLKAAVDQYLGSGDAAALAGAAVLLQHVAAALLVVERSRAHQLARRLESYVQSGTLATPGLARTEFERFADAVCALEVFLEAVRDALPEPGRLLDALEAYVGRLDFSRVPAVPATTSPVAAEAPLAETELLEEPPAAAALPVELVLPPAAEVPAAISAPASATATAPADDGVDPEIREIFIEEAREVLAQLQRLLPAFKREPGERESLTEVRRAFHTLKGSGRMAGALRIGELGWCLENLLNRCLDGALPIRPPIVQAVEQGIGLLPGLIDNFSTGSAEPDTVQALIDRAGALAAGPAAGEADVLGVFREDARERLGQVRRWLETLRPQGEGFALDPEVIRAFHTLRGSAAVINADGVSRLAGAFEAYLNGLHLEGQAVPVQSLAVFADALVTLLGWVDSFGVVEAGQAEWPAWEARLATLPGQRSAAPVRAAADDAFSLLALDLLQGAERKAEDWAREPLQANAAGAAASLGETFAELAGAAARARVSRIGTPAATLAARLAAWRGGQAPQPQFFVALAQILEGLYQELDAYRDGAVDATREDWNARAAALPEPPAEAPAAAPIEAAIEAAVATPAETPVEAPVETRVETITVAAAEPVAEPAAMFTAEPAPVSSPEALLAQPAAEPAPLGETLPFPADFIAAVPPPGEALPEPIAEPPPEAEFIELPAAEGLSEAADSFASELAAIFADEATDLVEQMERNLQIWRLQPEDAVTLDSLRRGLHTLVGSARTAAASAIAEVAQRLQPAFEPAAARPTAALQDAMSIALDEIHVQLANLRNGREPGAVAPILLAIDAALAAQTPPPAPAVAAAPAAALDEELTGVFVAEAGELLEMLDAGFDAWSKGDGGEPVRDVQRALHTLKGGARMAGLEDVADLAHALESRVDAAVAAGLLPDVAQFGRMRAEFGRLQLMHDQLRRGGPPAAAAPAAAPAPAAAAAAVVPVSPWSPELFWRPPDETAALAAGRRETSRVPVETLDAMLNEAGEISIYRSRLEERNASLRTQLAEMTQTIARVREQLRGLDIETEAQIAARGGVREPGGSDRYGQDFDPLEMDRYTRMQELSRALTESIGDLASLHGSMDEAVGEAETLLQQQSRINSEVQKSLMGTLMVPFSRQVQRLTRVVQQTAQEQGKQAEAVFEGIDAELDRKVLDRITAPLEHLLRNAVVHGIEDPAARTAAGKPAAGTINVRLAREGGQLTVEVTDDGRGLDFIAIRAKAVQRGLLAADLHLSDDELARFIFEPGFSTARELTQDAGRGIGMDVVASEVKQLAGTLELRSQPGQGTRFVLRLPLTLAVSQALLITVGQETYAVPVHSVEGVARIPRAELDDYQREDGPLFGYGGRGYRVRHLGEYVGQAHGTPTSVRSVTVILARLPEGLGLADRRVALIVDSLIGNREMVTKNTGPQLSSIAGIAGATVLADGRVVLILDIAALIAERARRILLADAAGRAPRAAAADPRETVFVVDDSITMRRVAERLLSRNGYRVLTAKDGLDAIALLQNETPDAVLLDIEMPRADGFEVAAFIRNNPRLRRAPIVMITSRSGDKHRERARALGVDRYLIKPYQEDQLLSELKALGIGAGR